MKLCCSAPAKIMLAGEYAVVDGGLAVLLAVNRRAYAYITEAAPSQSIFLSAVADQIEKHFGATSGEAQRARHVVVDTSEFCADSTKLGLGSSAAATVVAVGAALYSEDQGAVLDPDLVHRLARQAHGQAQASIGAQGSGADVAACSYGGIIGVQTKPPEQPSVTALALVSDTFWVFPWTGLPASTTTLLATMTRFRERLPLSYEKHCEAIRDSAGKVAAAKTANELVSAIGEGGNALRCLGESAGIELWLPQHTQMDETARNCGGALKPTGAGGGDLAVACFSSQRDADRFRGKMQEKEILCPNLAVDKQGVRWHS